MPTWLELGVNWKILPEVLQWREGKERERRITEIGKHYMQKCKDLSIKERPMSHSVLFSVRFAVFRKWT